MHRERRPLYLRRSRQAPATCGAKGRVGGGRCVRADRCGLRASTAIFTSHEAAHAQMLGSCMGIVPHRTCWASSRVGSRMRASGPSGWVPAPCPLPASSCRRGEQGRERRARPSGQAGTASWSKGMPVQQGQQARLLLLSQASREHSAPRRRAAGRPASCRSRAPPGPRHPAPPAPAASTWATEGEGWGGWPWLVSSRGDARRGGELCSFAVQPLQLPAQPQNTHLHSLSRNKPATSPSPPSLPRSLGLDGHGLSKALPRHEALQQLWKLRQLGAHGARRQLLLPRRLNLGRLGI